MALWWVEGLPGESLSAAADFHARLLPGILETLSGGVDHLTIVFAPADHTHRGWRLAVVQELAREHAPVRVNGLVSGEETAIAAAEAWLAEAKGVTGQLLALDGNGAGQVLYGGG